MKKSIIFSILLIFTSISVVAQEQESKVQHIGYQDFINKVWDFEKNPQSFVYKGSTPAIVDFYADWCGPCRKVSPIMERLAKEYDGRLVIYKVNVDKEKELASAFQVRSIPALLFIPKSGQPMMGTGAYPEEEYRKIIEEQLLK